MKTPGVGEPHKTNHSSQDTSFSSTDSLLLTLYMWMYTIPIERR
jgi:hypothetical protein